jgi:hypothetical protein
MWGLPNFGPRLGKTRVVTRYKQIQYIKSHSFHYHRNTKEYPSLAKTDRITKTSVQIITANKGKHNQFPDPRGTNLVFLRPITNANTRNEESGRSTEQSRRCRLELSEDW